jgi:ketosteroid isomerase-like protein
VTADKREIVRTLWGTLEREEGAPWPPPREELDRRLRLDLVDEQVEIRNPAEFPVGDEYRGHEGLRKWATEVWEVLGEVHHELVELIEAEDGETLVSVQRTRGRMRYTGLRVNLAWATVWTVRDGKLLRAHGYMTRIEALEAAGLAS